MNLVPRAGVDARGVGAQITLLTCASIAFLGYRFGNSNHSIQIPLLKHYLDPSLYAGDLLLSSFGGYVSYFFPAVAAVHRLVPDLQLLYFLLFVACHAATLAALRAIASDAFADSTAVGYWACFLYLANPISLAGESALSLRLYHSNVAVAILLWACWLALRGHNVAAMALAGFSFNIHALYAAYLGTILACTLWASPWRARLQAAAAYVMAASPALLWMLSSADPVPPSVRDSWLHILRERSGPHTFPSSQPLSLYAGYLVFLALGLLAASRIDGARYRRLVLTAVAVVTALCALGVIGSELYPVPILLKAQLLRSSKWLTLLLLPCLARQVVLAPGRGPLAVAAAATWAAGLFLQKPALLAYGLVLEAARLTRRTSRLALLGLAAVLGFAGWAGIMTPPPDLSSTLAGGLEALARPSILLCLAMAGLLRVTARRRWASASVALSIALAAGGLLPELYLDSRQAIASDPWYALQSWTREHTPSSAVVLSPPAREGFRVFSERAIVVEEKDGTQQFFAADFGFAWDRRLREINTLTKFYQRLSPAVVERVHKAYGITHLVVPRGTRCTLPRLFGNAAGSIHSAVAGTPAASARRASGPGASHPLRACRHGIDADCPPGPNHAGREGHRRTPPRR